MCPKKLVMITSKTLKENQDVLIVWLINRFLIELKTKVNYRLLCLNF